ncbi:hypothetical protein L1049_024733 [Liquidambar formosana]|uniref:Uncharacterized protein n=1 Tax=Liquidambar formosana TaxID=63359 RepID=A0AAP0RW70_LIQFO
MHYWEELFVVINHCRWTKLQFQERKSQLLVEDRETTSNEVFTSSSDEQLPEIEARVSDKNVFIVKTLNMIEKLNLTVVNTSAVPFGILALHITIVAQVGDHIVSHAYVRPVHFLADGKWILHDSRGSREKSSISFWRVHVNPN